MGLVGPAGVVVVGVEDDHDRVPRSSSEMSEVGWAGKRRRGRGRDRSRGRGDGVIGTVIGTGTETELLIESEMEMD